MRPKRASPNEEKTKAICSHYSRWFLPTLSSVDREIKWPLHCTSHSSHFHLFSFQLFFVLFAFKSIIPLSLFDYSIYFLSPPPFSLIFIVFR